MFSIARLLGSRSLPWLIRALLDHISNKVCHDSLKCEDCEVAQKGVRAVTLNLFCFVTSITTIDSI